MDESSCLLGRLGACTPSGRAWPERRSKRTERWGPRALTESSHPSSPGQRQLCRVQVTDQAATYDLPGRLEGAGSLGTEAGQPASMAHEGPGKSGGQRLAPVITHLTKAGLPPQPRPRWW